MFNKLSLLALAGLSFSSLIQADTIGFEVGAYQWMPDYSGVISVDGDTQTGDVLNLQDDLGFSDENHNVIWITLEHPIPAIPNIKLVSSDLDASATSLLEREFTFGNETFTVGEDIATRLDMSNIELTLYYELLDNWINLDFGVTLRQYDGVVTVESSTSTDSEKLDFIIPLLYLKGRVDLPLTGLFVDAELNILSISGDSLSDTTFSLGYESDFGLGAKAGYRIFELDVNENNFISDIKFDGAFASVFYHF